jgi:hypothetical protein
MRRWSRMLHCPTTYSLPGVIRHTSDAHGGGIDYINHNSEHLQSSELRIISYQSKKIHDSKTCCRGKRIFPRTWRNPTSNGIETEAHYEAYACGCSLVGYNISTFIYIYICITVITEYPVCLNEANNKHFRCLVTTVLQNILRGK